ncbi:LytR C-terminal domain-containing protein [Egicoccus sp. AB-alg2]|uniref:LytR C-terminal domain-containing protein n=1 Tax=Egicoccus sp. AB-alg2 TaxID=3242693 RepID=UPI00359D4670
MKATGTPEETGLGVAVGKRVGAAVGVVVLTAGAFAFIGARTDDAATQPTVASGPAPDDAPSAPEDTDESDGSDDTQAAAPDEPAEPAAPEPTEDPEPDPTEDAEEPAEVEEPEPEPEPTEESEPEPEPEPAARALAPGDVVIQVLDGYKADGGVAARGVAQSLRDQGYRVIAENQALNYQVTTVLWTEGNEAAARQVAAEVGAGDVRPQPGNLSNAVDVHVVVGADRG